MKTLKNLENMSNKQKNIRVKNKTHKFTKAIQKNSNEMHFENIENENANDMKLLPKSAKNSTTQLKTVNEVREIKKEPAFDVDDFIEPTTIPITAACIKLEDEEEEEEEEEDQDNDDDMEFLLETPKRCELRKLCVTQEIFDQIQNKLKTEPVFNDDDNNEISESIASNAPTQAFSVKKLDYSDKEFLSNKMANIKDNSPITAPDHKDEIYINPTTISTTYAVVQTVNDANKKKPLIKHLRFKCTECTQVFPKKPSLKRHILNCHTHNPKRKKSYACHQCPCIYSSSTSLGRHIKTQHLNLTKPSRLECTECSASYVSEFFLQKHIEREHTLVGEFTCAFCKEKVKGRTALKQHVIEIHTAIPSNYIYATTGQIITQNVIKENKRKAKKLVTETADSKESKEIVFKFIIHLLDNMETMAGQQKQIFQVKNYTIKHTDSKKYDNTGLVNFYCLECNKLFHKVGDINHHLKYIHSRKFQCNECNDTFKSRSHLMDHVAAVHPKNPSGMHKYHCALCPCIFKSKISFSRHLLHKHQCDADQIKIIYKEAKQNNKNIIIDVNSGSNNCMKSINYCDDNVTKNVVDYNEDNRVNNDKVNVAFSDKYNKVPSQNAKLNFAEKINENQKFLNNLELKAKSLINSEKSVKSSNESTTKSSIYLKTLTNLVTGSKNISQNLESSLQLQPQLIKSTEIPKNRTIQQSEITQKILRNKDISKISKNLAISSENHENYHSDDSLESAIPAMKIFKPTIEVLTHLNVGQSTARALKSNEVKKYQLTKFNGKIKISNAIEMPQSTISIKTKNEDLTCKENTNVTKKLYIKTEIENLENMETTETTVANETVQIKTEIEDIEYTDTNLTPLNFINDDIKLETLHDNDDDMALALLNNEYVVEGEEQDNISVGSEEDTEFFIDKEFVMDIKIEKEANFL